jgi:hypothetical protein
LKQGTSYKVSITAISAGGLATKAVSVTAKTEKLVGATKLAVEKGTKPTISSVKLEWKEAPSATGYKIEVWEPAKVKGGLPVLIRVVEPSEITGTKYEVTGLSASTAYTFRVIGLTAGGIETAAFSKVISTAKYTAVQKLQAAEKTSSSISLTWNVSKTLLHSSSKTRYEVVVMLNNAVVKTVPNITDASVKIPDLASNTKYTFVVKAITTVDGNDIESLTAKISVKTV